MSKKVLVLGAGFGGLELTTLLSEAMGDEVEITLIDKNDAFVFGFSKLDLIFGRATPEEIRHPYRDIVKPGVTVLQETVTGINPEARRVTTDAGTYEADALVIALGADYDLDATPGLAEGGNEFYSVPGAGRVAKIIPEITSGHIMIGVCGFPIKCPPAPSEFAMLLDEELTARGVRDACEISFVFPLDSSVPPSPETSAVLANEFAERNIKLLTGHRIASLDADRNVAVLEDGEELGFDLFFGVPKHRAPDVVLTADMTEYDFVPVEPATLKTKFTGVYAIGDVNSAEVPKAGVFSLGGARVVAGDLLAQWQGGEPPAPFDGRGSCYIEFGAGNVGRVDIDFLSGPEKTAVFREPSAELAAEKRESSATLAAGWFGT